MQSMQPLKATIPGGESEMKMDHQELGAFDPRS